MITRADRKLLHDLETCTLAAQEFGHREHVRVAWVLLREQPLDEALRRLETLLRRFASRQGKSDLYHATITWAFLFAIHERIAHLGADHAWREFAAANPQLLADGRNFLESYYTPRLLDSETARRAFVLPDRGIVNASGLAGRTGTASTRGNERQGRSA